MGVKGPPRTRLGRNHGWAPPKGVVVGVTLVLLASGFSALGAGVALGSRTAAPASVPHVPSPSAGLSLESWLSQSRAPVADEPSDTASESHLGLASNATGPLHVFVSLAFTNRSELLRALAPGSGKGHGTPPIPDSTFAPRFAPNSSVYGSILGYFRSFPGVVATGFPDRLAVDLAGPASQFDSAFGVRIEQARTAAGSPIIFPEGSPTLPASIAPWVASIVGLGDSPQGRARPAIGLQVLAPVSPSSAATASAHGQGARPALTLPLAPATVRGVQELYLPDFQVAYDEESLLAIYGAPTAANVAALLWDGSYQGSSTVTPCGALTTGEPVGPFVPGDFAAYFNETSPAGQPHAVLQSVPLSGSPPGCSSSWDSTGVNVANTAELEALGSTAPGATVWGVSVAQPTVADLDFALQSVLSPPLNLSAAARSGLANVSVVDAGWLFVDQNNSGWANLLLTATGRGVTIVTPTGDAADSASSAAWLGSSVAFPSSQATNTTGALAVGGTTVQLNAATLHLSGEVVWDNASATPANVRGSSGGISAVFPEPSWQASSLAASTLGGGGRGTPDLAAVANNSLVTVTLYGARWNASNATVSGSNFVAVNGTGLAAAVVAGLVATIDRALAAAGGPSLGFANPLLYVVATEEYSPLPANTIFGSVPYPSPLPTLPFHDIVLGRNSVNAASRSYDLVTGWGSLDAYNYTMYLMPAPTSPTWGRLLAVEDVVNLSSLAVSSTFPGGSPAPSTSASLQLNLFLANALGAPIYWVQSVTTFSYAGAGKWTVDYQAWLILPFWGLYPTLALYEYDTPPTVLTSLPLTLTLETTLLPGTPTIPSQLSFSYGGPSSPILTFPAPGAAYIVGSATHTYNWQGTNYTNGPNGSAPGGVTGFLAPQLGLVGSPSGGKANFLSGTIGSVTAFVEPQSVGTFLRAGTGLVTEAATQTGESASNLSYTSTGTNTYSFAFSAGTGAATQGIYEYELPRFQVKFTETGVPPRSTWYVNITGTVPAKAQAFGSSSTLTFSLPNGSYSWSGGINVKGWSSIPRGGPFTVAGGPLSFTLQFGQSTDTVSFVVLGPPTGAPLPFAWTVNITGGPTVSGTTTHLQATVFYGTYPFHTSDTNRSWRPLSPNATFVANAATTLVYVRINPVTYVCELVFRLPGGISPHMTVQIASHVAIGYFSTFSAKLQNGTANWSVGSLSSGSASPSHGTFRINGPGPLADKGKYVVVVTISEPPPFGLFGLGVWGYALVAGGVASGAALVVLLLLRRRHIQREREAKAPPAPPDEEAASAPFDDLP